MIVKSRFSRPRFRMSRPPSGPARWSFWLDMGMMMIWGILLFKYWLSGQILFLLHPDYVWLTIATGIILLAMVGFKIMQRWERKQRSPLGNPTTSLQHLSLLPRGWSSTLLLLIGILGLLYTPRPFASDIALQRGVADTVAVTRSQPQAFRAQVRPQDKSIVDWVRTLNVYPEPDAYMEQPVDVVGFMIHPPNLPDDYGMISRFILTCCAADAYPVGLPVKLTGDRSDYPADQWFRVKGEMATAELNGDRRLTVLAQDIESVETPRNPYNY